MAARGEYALHRQQGAPTTDDDTRGDDWRFLPGRTGNPCGSNRALHLARALAETGIVAVLMVEPRRTSRPAASARRPRRLAA